MCSCFCLSSSFAFSNLARGWTMRTSIDFLCPTCTYCLSANKPNRVCNTMARVCLPTCTRALDCRKLLGLHSIILRSHLIYGPAKIEHMGLVEKRSMVKFLNSLLGKRNFLICSPSLNIFPFNKFSHVKNISKYLNFK